jgi:hypothetical protein
LSLVSVDENRCPENVWCVTGEVLVVAL